MKKYIPSLMALLAICIIFSSCSNDTIPVESEVTLETLVSEQDAKDKNDEVDASLAITSEELTEVTATCEFYKDLPEITIINDDYVVVDHGVTTASVFTAKSRQVDRQAWGTWEASSVPVFWFLQGESSDVLQIVLDSKTNINSSYISFDGLDLGYESAVDYFEYTLPLSQYTLNDDDSDITFCDCRPAIDGIPVLGPLCFADSGLYAWNGYLEPTLGWGELIPIVVQNDDTVIFVYSNTYEKKDAVLDSVAIKPCSEVSAYFQEAIGYTLKNWGITMDTDVEIISVSLDYYPAMPYDVDTASYIDPDTFLMIPVWNLEFVTTNTSNDMKYNQYINAITGQPLYTMEYQVGDYRFLPGGR